MDQSIIHDAMDSNLQDRVSEACRILETLEKNIEHIIRGRTQIVRLILTALIADGHILLEDYPGSGKTTLAKVLGKSIALDETRTPIPFKRIQFTPDLLPSDILGVNIYEPATGTFRFSEGPIFSNIVLADEINRSSPKVQSALLESMAEKQVTIDRITYPLAPLFFVIATQNPIDMAGTYPLPYVQLDRFLMKVHLGYLSSQFEREIIDDYLTIQDLEQITPVCTQSEILTIRSLCNQIFVSDSIKQAIVQLIQATRESDAISLGASTRASIMLLRGVKALACMNHRTFVTEDDLVYLAPFILLHRLRFRENIKEKEQSFQQLLQPLFERLIRSKK